MALDGQIYQDALLEPIDSAREVFRHPPDRRRRPAGGGVRRESAYGCAAGPRCAQFTSKTSARPRPDSPFAPLS